MKLAEFLFIVLIGAAIYCLTVWKIACSGQKVEMKYLEIGIAGLVLISLVGQRTFSLISSMSAEHADESESLQLAQTIYQQGNSDLQNRLCNAYAQIGRRDEQIASLSQAIRRNRADKELLKNLKETGNTKALLEALVRSAGDKEQSQDKDVNEVVELNREIASVAELRGEIETAMQAIKKILAHRPEDLTALRDKGLLHYRLGNLGEAESDLTAVRDHSQTEAEKARALHSLGTFYEMVFRNSEAQATLESALQIARAIGDQPLVGICLFNLAGIHDRKGELQKANELLDEAMTMMDKGNDKQVEVAFYVNKALFLATEGELFDALESLQKAYGFVSNGSDKQLLSAICLNMGNLYDEVGNTDQAEEFTNRSLELDSELKSDAGLAVGYGNLAIIRKNQGRLGEAEDLCRKSLRIHKRLGHIEGTCMQLATLASIYTKRGDMGAAGGALAEAKECADQTGDVYLQALLMVNLGNFAMDQGDLGRANTLMESASQRFAVLRNDYGLGITALNRAALAQEVGNEVEATSLLHESRERFSRAELPHMVLRVDNELRKLSRAPEEPDPNRLSTLAFVATHCKFRDGVLFNLAYQGSPPYALDPNECSILFKDGKKLTVNEFIKETSALVRELAQPLNKDRSSLEELQKSEGTMIADVTMEFVMPAAMVAAHGERTLITGASAVAEISRTFGQFGEFVPFSLDRENSGLQTSASLRDRKITAVLVEDRGKTRIGFRASGLTVEKNTKPSALKGRVDITVRERR